MCVLAGLGGGAIDLLVAMAVASERSQVSLDRRLLAAHCAVSAFIVELAVGADEFEMRQLEQQTNNLSSKQTI